MLRWVQVIILLVGLSSTLLSSSLPDTTLLEPADGRTYHGTQTAFSAHIGYLAALSDSTIQPAVLGMFISIPGTRPPANTFNGLRQFFSTVDSVGFIPEIGLFLVTSSESPTGATDSIIAMSTQYDYFIDSIISISRNYGRRMFVRIGGEFNGWWNGGGYHPYYYVTAFRKILARYAAQGFRDSIASVWCYEPDAANDFDSVGVNGPLWYPGDAYVDWFGLDVFDANHFDPAEPEYRNGVITKKGKSERFLAMARTKGKPVYLNETSAIRVNITADSIDSYNDWNAWFAKYWTFIDNHIEIKGFNYMSQDWDATGGYPGWGDARIQNSPYIMNWYKQEMRRPKYIHLHSSLTSVKAVLTVPDGFMLGQNYPNPFNPTTTITYSLPSQGINSVKGRVGVGSHVMLKVFDVLGREVATLVNEQLHPGSYQATFDGGRLAGGVYFYRLTAGLFTATKKLLLVK